MGELLIVSSSPHIRDGSSVRRIMLDVIIALVPASLFACYIFGFPACQTILSGVTSAVVTEWVLHKLTGRVPPISDMSAAVTGLLLALCLPPTVPWWLPAVGSFIAIAIAKFPFGGLGYNPFNPAHIGRAFLLASWPVLMTTWKWPTVSLPGAPNVDAVSSATALSMMKYTEVMVPYPNLFFGNVAGSTGETSAVALLIGAAYLIYRQVIDWRIPASYLAVVAVLAALFGQSPMFHLLAGGLILGAFYMATDYSTTPVTPKGRITFGIGCGLITIMIRLFGGYPEGVCYAILIMNAATPLIDRFTRPRVFGEVKVRA